MTETDPASWANLWDKTEAVALHTQRGIDFLERYGQFVKERAAIEEEYAQKLKNLIKKSVGKKKEDDECKYSYVNTFYSILRELESLANQHEIVGEQLRNEVVPKVSEKCRHLRGGRKEHLQELSNLKASLNAQVDIMQKLQKNYQKAHKDAEAAYIKFDKADKNMDLSRADVEKTKNTAIAKSQICEQAKQSYAHGLESANRAQFDHYHSKLPFLLDEMRKLDVHRIEETKSSMLRSVEIETAVFKIVQRCYDDMKAAIATINPEHDTKVVVDKNKSGYAHEPDYEFHDLGCPSAVLNGNGESMIDGVSATLKRGALIGGGKNANGKGIPRKHSMHQRLFGGSTGGHKANQAANDYSHLPPQQRCNKIESKIQELLKEIATREQSHEGLARMHGVYTNNPSLGKASDVEGEMAQYQKEIAELHAHVDRFKRLLADAQSELNTPLSAGSSTAGGSPRIMSNGGQPTAYNNNTKRTSYSEESISSEGSARGSTNRLHNPNLTPNGQHNPISPRSEKPPEKPPIQPELHHIDSNPPSEFFDDELPPLGTCMALYPFEGSNDGTTIAMKEGEEMLLLEKDTGDGWTRVRHITTQVEGFVPSSYIKVCKVFSE